jgi:hypothetical protein
VTPSHTPQQALQRRASERRRVRCNATTISRRRSPRRATRPVVLPPARIDALVDAVNVRAAPERRDLHAAKLRDRKVDVEDDARIVLPRLVSRCRPVPSPAYCLGEASSLTFPLSGTATLHSSESRRAPPREPTCCVPLGYKASKMFTVKNENPRVRGNATQCNP